MPAMTEKFFYGWMRFRERFRFLSALRRYRTSRSFYAQPAEHLGLTFRNPLGLAGMDAEGRYADMLSNYGFGWIVTGPFYPEKNNVSILEAIPRLKTRSGARIAAALSRRPGETQDEIVMNDYRIPFSLLYDFVDLFIVEMDIPELESVSDVLDELLSLRLCYEQFRPILVRLPAHTPPDELHDILAFCLISGIDGIVAEGSSLVAQVKAQIQSRMVLVGAQKGMTGADAGALRAAGADLILMDGGLAQSGRKGPKNILKTLKSKSL